MSDQKKRSEEDNELLALVDFVKANPRGLRSVGLAQAMEVVNCLIDERMLLPEKLVFRALSTSYSDELILLIADRLKGTKDWENFIFSLFSIPEDKWVEEGGRFDGLLLSISVLRKIITDIRDFDLLLQTPEIRQKLTDENYPLCDSLNMDPYWSFRVRQFIEMNNLRRAFDELVRAFGGIRHIILTANERKLHALQGDLENYEPRYLKASRQTLKILVSEVFALAVAKDMCRPIVTIEDEKYSPQRVAGIGWRFADYLNDIETPEETKLWFSGNAYSCEECIMILRMVKAFQAERNKKRQKRKLAKLEEQD